MLLLYLLILLLLLLVIICHDYGTIQVVRNAVLSDFLKKSVTEVYGSTFLALRGGGCPMSREVALRSTWMAPIVDDSHTLSSIVSTCSSVQLLSRPAMAAPTDSTFEETYELVNEDVDRVGRRGESTVFFILPSRCRYTFTLTNNGHLHGYSLAFYKLPIQFSICCQLYFLKIFIEGVDTINLDIIIQI